MVSDVTRWFFCRLPYKANMLSPGAAGPGDLTEAGGSTSVFASMAHWPLTASLSFSPHGPLYRTA